MIKGSCKFKIQVLGETELGSDQDLALFLHISNYESNTTNQTTNFEAIAETEPCFKFLWQPILLLNLAPLQSFSFDHHLMWTNPLL